MPLKRSRKMSGHDGGYAPSVGRAAGALLAIFMCWLLLGAPSMAQEANRAGLVVVHGDGNVVTRCVRFDEPSISGAELIVRSGLSLAVEASGMGATICRLDGEGCSYPEESCFCQCQGSPCIYWSYWQLTGDEWVYSALGAANAAVKDGAVEGWRWGAGTVEKAEPPPLLTLDAICAEAETQVPVLPAEATAASEPAAPVVKSTGMAVDPPSEMLSAQQAAPSTTVDAPDVNTAAGILVGVLVGLPVVALVMMWLRRTRGGGSA